MEVSGFGFRGFGCGAGLNNLAPQGLHEVRGLMTPASLNPKP